MEAQYLQKSNKQIYIFNYIAYSTVVGEFLFPFQEKAKERWLFGDSEKNEACKKDRKSMDRSQFLNNRSSLHDIENRMPLPSYSSIEDSESRDVNNLKHLSIIQTATEITKMGRENLTLQTKLYETQEELSKQRALKDVYRREIEEVEMEKRKELLSRIRELERENKQLEADMIKRSEDSFANHRKSLQDAEERARQKISDLEARLQASEERADALSISLTKCQGVASEAALETSYWQQKCLAGNDTTKRTHLQLEMMKSELEQKDASLMASTTKVGELENKMIYLTRQLRDEFSAARQREEKFRTITVHMGQIADSLRKDLARTEREVHTHKELHEYMMKQFQDSFKSSIRLLEKEQKDHENTKEKVKQLQAALDEMAHMNTVCKTDAEREIMDVERRYAACMSQVRELQVDLQVINEKMEEQRCLHEVEITELKQSHEASLTMLKGQLNESQQMCRMKAKLVDTLSEEVSALQEQALVSTEQADAVRAELQGRCEELKKEVDAKEAQIVHLSLKREYEKNKKIQELCAVSREEGREEGRKEGREEGRKEGKEEGIQEGWQRGWDEGVAKGREEGNIENFEKGKLQGHKEGTELGLTQGISIGKDMGYEEGRQCGFKEGQEVGLKAGKEQGKLEESNKVKELSKHCNGMLELLATMQSALDEAERREEEYKVQKSMWEEMVNNALRGKVHSENRAAGFGTVSTVSAVRAVGAGVVVGGGGVGGGVPAPRLAAVKVATEVRDMEALLERSRSLGKEIDFMSIKSPLKP